jgi:hypothetical protein
MDHSFKNSSFFGIVYIVGAILASMPAVYIIRRYFPWMIGQGGRKKETLIPKATMMR